MTTKRKASASFECSSSERAWYWRPGIFRAITKSFYRSRKSTSSRPGSTLPPGQNEPIDVDEDEQHRCQSTSETRREQSVQAAQVSPAIDQEGTPASEEGHNAKTGPNEVQQSGGVDNHSFHLNQPSPTVSSSIGGSTVDVLEDSTTSPQSRRTWNHARLRVRSPREDTNNHTQVVRSIFQDAYECQYSQSQFVGLCAYLSAVMRLGYHIDTAEIDGFIRMHTMFTRELKYLEEQQTRNADTKLVAYHHWYARRGRGAIDGAKKLIVTESDLRRIWSENPFTFLKVRRCLDRVIDGRT